MANKLGCFNSVCSDKGVPIQATVAVYLMGTLTLAATYLDEAGTIILTNPFSTDALGRFSFWAEGGAYTGHVSGSGITAYDIPIYLALTGPAGSPGPIDGIQPETYGAVGDGTTDDRIAFQDMFDDLAGKKFVKVILRPTNYYSIKSRKNSTNVFEITGITSLQMIGPGMSIKTIAYENIALPATNFFHFDETCESARLSEMKILGSPEVDIDYPIENIVYMDNCIYFSYDRLILGWCTGRGIAGFNWMTELRHVVFNKCDIGSGSIDTTAHVLGAYANECRIGFDITCMYGFYAACASDWADIAYQLNEPWSVNFSGCGCEKAHQVMSGRALQLSIQGFTVDQTDVLGSLNFTSGGTYEIKPFDTITGATSGKTATVYRVHVTSGSWAAGTAAGTLRINNAPSGAFVAENLNVGAHSDVCTIAGDLALPESAFYLPQTNGSIGGLYGKIYNKYWFDGTNNSPNLTISPPEGYTGKFKALIKDYSSAEYMSVPIILGANDYTGYNQYVHAMADLRALLESDFSKYRSCQEVEILLEDGTATYASTVNWANAAGVGSLLIRNNATEFGPIIVLNPTSGVGMTLTDIQIPIIFRNIYFKLSKQVHMIEIVRCRLIRFENCKIETTAGGGRVFNIDEYSNVEIDKATMDNMVTTDWWALDNSGRGDAIKFIGYSAKPTSGLFGTGHRVDYLTPSSAGYAGAVCTSGGVPGTWKGVGLVE